MTIELLELHECIRVCLPNITTIRSASSSAQSTANDASQPVGAPNAEQSPEDRPGGTSKTPIGTMDRPEVWAGLGSSQHDPSLCPLSTAASISTCSALEASLAQRPHQAQALPQAPQPGQHRQITPIFRYACGHWSRASTWETSSHLWDIQQTSPNHVGNV